MDSVYVFVSRKSCLNRYQGQPLTRTNDMNFKIAVNMYRVPVRTVMSPATQVHPNRSLYERIKPI